MATEVVLLLAILGLWKIFVYKLQSKRASTTVLRAPAFDVCDMLFGCRSKAWLIFRNRSQDPTTL